MKTRLDAFDLLVEIWSDVVCPWCYIGKRNLEMALADFEGDVEVKHRAFRLDPHANQTRPSVDALGEKYGVGQVSAMMDRVSMVAANVGLNFKLEETMTGNTLDAHRLLLWAQSQGDAQPLLTTLYRAHFEESESIFDTENLTALAVSAGYPQDAVKALLAGNDFASEVEADLAMAAALGANGVPFFVIDGKYGVSGAQSIETFTQVLVKASS